MNDITDENGRVSQYYLIEKLKNKINFFSEFSRLKKAIPKEWYVQLSEEKSVKTTINIKKENIISAGRVIESGRFGALKSDSTHHFFRNACTKSGSLRFSQFSGC